MQRAVKKLLTVTRKAMALLLVSVYILFSVGIIKATHFCMGREASVAFFTSEAKKCPCSLYALEKNSCCDDHHELIKIDDEQKVITAISAALPVWKIERIFTERLLTSILKHQPSHREMPDKAPPKIAIWKANCSYVFYDDESVLG
jgi:hypothetical protein